MKSTTLVSVALLALAQAFEVSAGGSPTINEISMVKRQASATVTGVQPSSKPALQGELRPQGCFLSSGNLTKTETENGESSSGACWTACKAFAVSAMRAYDCFCGDSYPPEDTLTDDADCSYGCPNYPQEACGNLNSPRAWSVFNTGLTVDVEFDDPPPESTSSSTAPTSSATNSASNPPQQSSTGAPSDGSSDGDENNDDGNDGPNVVAIVAGIVGGVVAIAAVAAGFWFFLRRRRNAEIEEEHRRNAAVNAFISGAKPPSSSGNISLTDSRLEPGLGARRMSDGSIADNQDYSRKILRVTNA